MKFSLSIKTADELAAEAATNLRGQIIAAIDAHIEAQARLLGYNSAANFSGYKDSTNAAWAAEASKFIVWRDRVWEAAFELDAQHNLKKASPTAESVISALPRWVA